MGRIIYLDALANGLPVRPQLLVTFLSGPPGLLLHIVIKAAAQALRGDNDTAGDRDRE